MAVLTTKAGKRLNKKTFALPEKRAYPLPDKARASNAIARVKQVGTKSEQKRVPAAVKSKNPTLAYFKKKK